VPAESQLRFCLLLAALLILRRTRLPAHVEIPLGTALFLATLAGAANWYHALSWLDWVAHTVVPALACLAFCHHRRVRILSRAAETVKRRVFAMVAISIGFGLTIAVTWETYEWLSANLFAARTISIDGSDTIEDLTAAAFGSAIAGAWAAHMELHRRRMRFSAIVSRAGVADD
jgi:hypothetical protein